MGGDGWLSVVKSTKEGAGGMVEHQRSISRSI